LQIFNNGQIPPPKIIFNYLASFVIATTIHEFMHAYTAWKLGDETARNLGRITFNPIAHFDPYGFFGMVMISLGYSFIGWGKPVPVNVNRLNNTFGKGIDGRKRAMAVIAAAGPISNIVQAAFGSGVQHLLQRSGNPNSDLILFIQIYVIVNMLLASFNMIPIPPLDGHKIMLGLLPNFWYPVLAPLERYGFMILFGLFFISGRGTIPSITAEMINPMYNLLSRVLY
jgi:Zn-dependent protease